MKLMSIIKKTHQVINFDMDQKISASLSYKKRQTDIFETIRKYRISQVTAQKLTNDLIGFTIPSGLKASIKGNHFNKIIGNEIKRLISGYSHIEFKTELSHKLFHEKLDWYLYNKNTKKTIAGFNQIDLWNGGSQYNRGSKYILDDNLHKNLSKRKVKLLCVVYAIPKKINEGTKLDRILSVGFKKQRLCYIKALKNIIYEFCT
jgi:hypothetical protein